MNRLPYLCLAALVLTAALPLRAQSALQSQLEVNLGPILMDAYDGISPNNASGVASGPNIPACSYSGQQSNYRTCIQAVLNSYGQQGVTGVRFQFGMNEAGSTPFVNGTVDPNWLAKLSLFFEDLRAANIQYVSFSPAWIPWTLGNMATYACISGPPYTYNLTCTSASANAVYYPWLPWPLAYSPANGMEGPFDQFGNFAYSNSPYPQDSSYLPHVWQWSSSPGSSSPLFQFFDGIFTAVANAQLSVREFDLLPEVPMYLSSAYARLIYDPVQGVHPLEVVNQIMRSHQLFPTAMLSTAAAQPGYQADCSSLSGDSALVLNAYLALSAMTGGGFGRVSGSPSSANSLYCGNTIDPHDLTLLPTPTQQESPGWSGPIVIDVHAYPADAIYDLGWGWMDNPNSTGCQLYPDRTAVLNYPAPGGGYMQNCSSDTDSGNSTGSSQTAANLIYGAINNFVQRWQGAGVVPGSATVIIGETDEYNPGGTGRDGLYFPPMTEGASCSPYGPYNILTDAATDPVSGVHYVNYWCETNWSWHAPWSSKSAGDNVRGFVATGLNRSNVVMRPWVPVGWGTVLSPAPLSGSSTLPYNVGACTYSLNVGSNVTLQASGATLSIQVTNTQNSQNCQWSAAPTPPANSTLSNPYPGWLTPLSPTWQTGTQLAAFTYSTNSSPTQQGPFYLTVAGRTIAITQLAGTAQLTFAMQPANGMAGAALPAVVVQVQDFNGNVVTSSNAPVTLTSSPAGINTTVLAVNGVATFSGLVFSSPGNYTLTASSMGLSSATSNSFSIANWLYTISGQVTVSGVGVGGVTITLSGNGSPITASTNASGNYSLFTDTNGAYTVTASLSGYGFSAPVNFASLTTSQTANFTGIPGLDFYPVTPCRVADTRAPAGFSGAFGPPSMAAGSTRTFNIPASSCGIPSTAVAYSLNFTVVPPGPLGNLTTWPTGQSMPNVSTLNDPTGTVVANAAIVPAGTNGGINVVVTDATNVLFDINGYFAPPLTPGLEFYTVTPCRIADTRIAAGFPGAFGPPSMAAGSQRSFPVLSSSCMLPATASVYSLNFTVVPPGPLGNLTTWPSGQSMPNVSTLNDSTGAVLANAAMVPAGSNGAINVYVTDPANVLFDINGYFAPALANGLHFYPVTPCRVADTRTAAGFPAPFGPPSLAAGTTRTFPVPSSSCGIPSTAAAYSLNFTVIPPGILGNLTTWPAGLAMPNVSTLNDSTGTVLANAAIVPAGAGGAISVYVTHTTDVVFDINGYFAP